jgi:hypothetical protein
MPKVIAEFDTLSVKNQWHIRELLPHNRAGLEYMQTNRNYQKKLLPAGTDLYDNDFIAVGSAVLIVSAGESPYALFVDDKPLAASIKAIFNILWNTLP